IGNPSLNHRYRKGFYSLFKTLQQNRHYYDLAEIEEEVQRPVIQQLFALLKFRNESAAFDLDGTIEVATPSESEIVITRKNKNGSDSATLTANLDTKEFIIESKDIKIFTSVALKF
ncbi:hypothetical protein SKA35_13685, partial [Enterococcus faecium]